MRKPVKVYTPLMRYEKILYAIQDVELFVPVTYRQIGFFLTSLAAIFIISNIPGLGFLKEKWLITYIGLPWGFTYFFTKFKLDGKAPLTYIADLIAFKLSPGITNRYEEAGEPAKYQYKTAVTYRERDEKEC